MSRISNAHKKQVLTYLKLTGMRLGYLLNFGEAMMKTGITRTVNGIERREYLATPPCCANSPTNG